MKNTILISIALVLVSCGRRPGKIGHTGANGNDGIDGLSLVVDVQTQAALDGTVCKRTDIFRDLDRNNSYSVGDAYQNGFLVCNGAIGAQGIQGAAGNNGTNGTNGADGQNGIDGVNGIDGTNGTNGQDGLNGVDGINGTNGVNGLDADLTYQIVEVVDPCGQQHPNGYDEVILKLGNGKYLSSFSDNANGLNTRFGILKAGNYVTTDGTGCQFNIP